MCRDERPGGIFAYFVEIIVGALIAMYFPITAFSLYALVKGRVHRNNEPVGFRPMGRKIIVEIVTNGQNPEVVEDIITKLRTFKLEFETYVLKEAYDKFAYSAKEITVPLEYKTKNGSFKKMRALQYGIEYLHALGFDSETYILHLDDDSIVNESYIRIVEVMSTHAGQGSIRLRGYGTHLMSTLADMIRVSDCEIYCKNFNEKGKPKLIHGEGLVIRADVEYDIGWDYGGYGAEDLIMGISLPAKGYTFGHIPDYVYISPPTSTVDFYKQRRRWTYSIIDNRNIIEHLNRTAMLFIGYRYAVGWAGILGMSVWFVDLLLGVQMPWIYTVFGGFNLVMSLLIYEYGVWKTSIRYALWMAVMLIPIAFYEGGTFIYTLLRPPKRNTFDVIRKVRI